MNTRNEIDKVVDEILKEAHKEIEPLDSWQALRTRIDRRIDSGGLLWASAAGMKKNIVFWRRLAFGMAACFLLTVGVLIYFLGLNYSLREYKQKQLVATASDNLLNQTEINRLRFAFSQVRQLFGKQSQWMMIGSGNSTQIGLVGEMAPIVRNRDVVVVRLALNIGDVEAPRQYFDVVVFSNQEANFRLPVAYASAIDVSLKPVLRDDGTIEVEINAQADGVSKAGSISTVADDTFTSLIRMRANGNWVEIDGVGQLMSNI